MKESICDNCGEIFPLEEADNCESCGQTLCPDCICEDCEDCENNNKIN